MRKKIIVIGGSGLIGRNLIPKLLIEGFSVTNLDLHKIDLKDKDYQFKKLDILRSKIKPDLFEDSKAVINLIGYPINKRWTQRNMKKIYDSRVLSSQKLVEAINATQKTPKVLISASGISVYKKESVNNTEESKTDDRFIANLVKEWEKPILNSKKRVIYA